MDTFPKVVRLVGADSNVVHSYAAIAIERLLALTIAGTPLFAPADVSQHLEGLLKLLFEALGKEDSTENEYLVKCVMRVVTFVGPQIVPIAGQCLDWCAAALALLRSGAELSHTLGACCCFCFSMGARVHRILVQSRMHTGAIFAPAAPLTGAARTLTNSLGSSAVQAVTSLSARCTMCRLTAKLLEVCKNPVFAGFNHYLFESVAALLVAARGDAATLASLETRIFGAFEIVLQQDVQEFHPYVFQVFALVLSASKELRPEYVEARRLFPCLLACLLAFAWALHFTSLTQVGPDPQQFERWASPLSGHRGLAGAWLRCQALSCSQCACRPCCRSSCATTTGSARATSPR